MPLFLQVIIIVSVIFLVLFTPMLFVLIGDYRNKIIDVEFRVVKDNYNFWQIEKRITRKKGKEDWRDAEFTRGFYKTEGEAIERAKKLAIIDLRDRGLIPKYEEIEYLGRWNPEKIPNSDGSKFQDDGLTPRGIITREDLDNQIIQERLKQLQREVYNRVKLPGFPHPEDYRRKNGRPKSTCK